MINYSYSDLVKRLEHARSWAEGVTEGNRCALVVGVALNIKPKSERESFRALKTGVVDGVKGMPFLAKFFLKAQDLADATAAWFGPPEICEGRSALKSLSGRKGVIFMQDCWGGTINLGVTSLRIRDDTFDHIDLWDGNQIEIYKGTHSVKSIHAFVQKSKSVWFWEVKKLSA